MLYKLFVFFHLTSTLYSLPLAFGDVVRWEQYYIYNGAALKSGDSGCKINP